MARTTVVFTVGCSPLCLVDSMWLVGSCNARCEAVLTVLAGDDTASWAERIRLAKQVPR